MTRPTLFLKRRDDVKTVNEELDSCSLGRALLLGELKARVQLCEPVNGIARQTAYQPTAVVMSEYAVKGHV